MKEMLERIEIYKQQEEQFKFDSFDSYDAWRLGSIMAKMAMENNYEIAIDISARHQQLFRFANKGTRLGTTNWLLRKIRTVYITHHSTLLFATVMKSQGKKLSDVYLQQKQYVLCGGGFPIYVKGEGLVGTIAVSGLTDVEDHQVMVDALAEFFATK